MAISIRRLDAYPSPALFGEIRFSVETQNTSGSRLMVTDSRMTIFVQDSEGRQIAVGTGLQTNPEEAIEVGRSSDAQLQVCMPLTPVLLQELEEHRGGRRLDLRAEVVILGFDLDKTPGQLVPFRETRQRSLTIEKSRWVEEFLPVFGYEDFEMWELRFPKVGHPAMLNAETDLLRKAISDYNRGEYEDAFKDCRALVESLKARDKELSLVEVVGKEEWSRSMHYLSIALHSESAIPRRIVRADAEFALSLTKAIHQRVAHAIRNPTQKSPP